MSVSSASLAGKVAFVQGGSRGIGAAIVRRLAAEGASVAFTYVSSADKSRALAAELEGAGASILALHADSADAAARFGRIDILVNNAAVLALGSVEELPLADFERTLAINVRSVFVATQAAVKHMGDGGRVISIGSTNAERMPFAGGATYAMSKSALVGLTKGLARDLGPRGITVNNVQPGPVDTDMNPDDGDFAEALKGLMALPRYARSEEIASFVAYLAGPEAAYITGASLTIDGGFSA
ncbi:3-oxoacyl-ACP reductase FabG [Pseudomonas aeruginosa]|uniref:3-oxoacyl-ACP reductase family protein n=2 Tax=Pseudomonas aeruginosa TaxID=287 RepID=UPI0009A39DCA|nr:3-oxoacyl-ACP reductase family protein [Pseudomonas aeruginosa]MBW6292065.1 3-oxoacyl-ACP reductase FabG [Pseudomonas aeruginosa]MBW6375123.1 3-oxoacyl-ACP reductase FabG [Pseudomonas aeruginosa]MBW6382685.1 3-oxoacyl-ACP reductase FabG [Pseudomonas aeruginosa]MDP5464605.1 3-oxoacyl-ACP reductase FabG [Pseudomonas aeruginosa]MDV7961319.1 3-oxoacyl-ACP reductase family protein [Pseudomonas aeruginosa]